MISNPARNASPDGEFVRDTTYIADSFSADLAPGSAPQPADDGTCAWPIEPGRYRLMAARACPWAHRAIIVRRLLACTSSKARMRRVSRAIRVGLRCR